MRRDARRKGDRSATRPHDARKNAATGHSGGLERFRVSDVSAIEHQLKEMLAGAVFEVTIDGVAHRAPFDVDFSDLTADEGRRAAYLPVATTGSPTATDDPELLVAAFLFVKVCRHIPELGDEHFAAFADGLAPLFAGDGSIVEARRG